MKNFQSVTEIELFTTKDWLTLHFKKRENFFKIICPKPNVFCLGRQVFLLSVDILPKSACKNDFI